MSARGIFSTVTPAANQFGVVRVLSALTWIVTNLDSLVTLVGTLRSVAGVVEPIQTVAGLRKRIDLALEAANKIADGTAAGWDDTAVDMAKSLASSEATLAVLASILVAVLGEPEHESPVAGDPLVFGQSFRAAVLDSVGNN